MDNYTKALHIYEDLPTHGKRSSQYLTTLTNLGSLYRELAMQKKGVEKHELLQRAVEALAEVCETRLSIQGEPIESVRFLSFPRFTCICAFAVLHPGQDHTTAIPLPHSYIWPPCIASKIKNPRPSNSSISSCLALLPSSERGICWSPLCGTTWDWFTSNEASSKKPWTATNEHTLFVRLA